MNFCHRLWHNLVNKICSKLLQKSCRIFSLCLGDIWFVRICNPNVLNISICNAE